MSQVQKIAVETAVAADGDLVSTSLAAVVVSNGAAEDSFGDYANKVAEAAGVAIRKAVVTEGEVTAFGIYFLAGEGDVSLTIGEGLLVPQVESHGDCFTPDGCTRQVVVACTAPDIPDLAGAQAKAIRALLRELNVPNVQRIMAFRYGIMPATAFYALYGTEMGVKMMVFTDRHWTITARRAGELSGGFVVF